MIPNVRRLQAIDLLNLLSRLARSFTFAFGRKFNTLFLAEFYSSSLPLPVEIKGQHLPVLTIG